MNKFDKIKLKHDIVNSITVIRTLSHANLILIKKILQQSIIQTNLSRQILSMVDSTKLIEDEIYKIEKMLEKIL